MRFVWAALLLPAACSPSGTVPGTGQTCPNASYAGVYAVSADAFSTDCQGAGATPEASLPPSAFFAIVPAGDDAYVYFCADEATCRGCLTNASGCSATFTGNHLSVAPSYLGNLTADGCGEFEGGFADYDPTAGICRLNGLAADFVPQADGTVVYRLARYERDVSLSPADCADQIDEANDLPCLGSELLTAKKL